MHILSTPELRNQQMQSNVQDFMPDIKRSSSKKEKRVRQWEPRRKKRGEVKGTQQNQLVHTSFHNNSLPLAPSTLYIKGTSQIFSWRQITSEFNQWWWKVAQWNSCKPQCLLYALHADKRLQLKQMLVVPWSSSKSVSLKFISSWLVSNLENSSDKFYWNSCMHKICPRSRTDVLEWEELQAIIFIDSFCTCCMDDYWHEGVASSTATFPWHNEAANLF